MVCYSKVKHGPLTCYKNHVTWFWKRLGYCSNSDPSGAASPAQGLAAPLCSLASLPPVLSILVNCKGSQGAARVLNTVPGWQTHSKSLALGVPPKHRASSELSALTPRLEPKSLYHFFRFSQNSCRAPQKSVLAWLTCREGFRERYAALQRLFFQILFNTDEKESA